MPRQRFDPVLQRLEELLHALQKRFGIFPPAVQLGNCLSHNPSQFNIRRKTICIRELLLVQLRRTDVGRQVEMDIVVENLRRQAHFGPPHAVKDVDRPPDPDTVLAFDWVDELGFGDVVIHPDTETETHCAAE